MQNDFPPVCSACGATLEADSGHACERLRRHRNIRSLLPAVDAHGLVEAFIDIDAMKVVHKRLFDTAK